MDASLSTWLSEMGMEDPALINQWQPMNSLPDNSLHEFSSLCLATFTTDPENLKNSPTDHVHNSQVGAQKLAPKVSSSSSSESYTSSNLISFENSDTKQKCSLQRLYGNLNFSEFGEESERIGTGTKMWVQAKDHVVAERMRRERLSQHFIALSALLPGLNKLDKASVLEHATKYIKELEEQVNALNEGMRKKPVESVVCNLKKSGDSENFDDSFSSSHLSPEVEVKICDNDALVRIQCQKHNGIVAKIFSEMDSSHLLVINSNVIPFGTGLSVTIVAQMDDEFSMTAKDLVKTLINIITTTSI
ncbi:basic helix-loop-helix (bHLH) DNA-binding superfamily protein [Actinidia rufa]|uniref:Basic helix-loop-helix (BHLH) DNA-binding superfamily protein n=1 Tax=Actinidia rufa TaxID=165716 RepID=A0A7J0H749_9ERIC|nr:basic helix-loop-helix (bHLH) DNA-binding superfamily protein [Actinidia rufa]